MWQELLDFFYPKSCFGCGKLEVDVCDDCRKELPVSEQICPMCGRISLLGWTHERCNKKEGMDGLTILYQYQDAVTRKLVDTIKYSFNRKLVFEILRDFVFEVETVFDYVTPVPLFFYRKNWRGFNQAEEMARVIVSKMPGPVYRDLLVRVRNTKQQALMKTKTERINNIRNAFITNLEAEKLNLKGKKVLLVDDVFTSGTNMRECTKMLKKAGADFVWGIVLAH